MTLQLHTLIAISGLVPSILSISRSIGHKVYFLGQSIGDFEASDDDPMVLMVDPRC